MSRYKVDFYDAFDGWISKGIPDPKNEFGDLEQAKARCTFLMQTKGPFGMDEHYGVIDLTKNREVFCGRHIRPLEPKVKTE